MRKKYFNVVLSLTAMAILTSCGDFLKEVSQDEFEPKNAQSYQELLNGTGYSTIITLDPLTHIMTDDVSTGAADSYTYSETNLAYKDIYTWQSYMDGTLQAKDISNITSSYQDIYSLIMTCNTVIDGINKVSGSDDEKKQTIGEAKALRAYYYWYLVNLYAKPYNTLGTTPDHLSGVPLITSAEIKDEGPVRNTVAEVYSQICVDIEDACTLLEEEKATKVSLFRINYAAAHLLASRIYLYMENWDKVIEHVNASLKGAPSLCDLNTYSLDKPSSPRNATNQIISKSFPEVMYIGGSHRYEIQPAQTTMCVSEDLVNTYSSDDKRKDIYFEEQGSWAFYRYLLVKYGASEQEFVWRTAELYLNRAEAYAMKFKAGDQKSGASAVEDLNILRRNRIANVSYTPYTLSTVDDLVTFLRAERRRELCFENSSRWFDLRRYGMPSIRHMWVDAAGIHSYYTLKVNDLGYVLPIPTKALTLNTNLVQNELAPDRKAETE
jgi:SusD family.